LNFVTLLGLGSYSYHATLAVMLIPVTTEGFQEILESVFYKDENTGLSLTI